MAIFLLSLVDCSLSFYTYICCSLRHYLLRLATTSREKMYTGVEARVTVLERIMNVDVGNLHV